LPGGFSEPAAGAPDAYAAVVASEVAVITTMNLQIDRLGAVVGNHFWQTPGR
jgi:hypothetical protein